MSGDNEIERFFFAAMRKGWVKGKTPSSLKGFPGSQIITVANGVFQLTDLWVVGEQGRSAGMTTITEDNKPVWAMQYSGQYSDAVIAFLMRALAKAYKEGGPVLDPTLFLGCRGPRTFAGQEWVYSNVVEPGSDFWHFSGQEQIVTRDGKCLGWHQYRGMRLFGTSLV